MLLSDGSSRPGREEFMTSQRKIDANRRNAQKSTGPKTEAGKARSRVNAVRHGLTAIHVTHPHEDPAAYADILSGLIESHAPANASEHQCVQMLATSWLAMQRCERMQTALMGGMVATIKSRHGKDETPDENDDLGMAIAIGDPEINKTLEYLSRAAARAWCSEFIAVRIIPAKRTTCCC